MNRPWYINAPQVPDGSPPSPNLSLRSPRNLFELAPQTFGKMLHFLFLNNHLHLKRLQDLRRNIFFLLLNWAIKNFGCSPIILFASSFAHHLSKKKNSFANPMLFFSFPHHCSSSALSDFNLSSTTTWTTWKISFTLFLWNMIVPEKVRGQKPN